MSHAYTSFHFRARCETLRKSLPVGQENSSLLYTHAGIKLPKHYINPSRECQGSFPPLTWFSSFNVVVQQGGGKEGGLAVHAHTHDFRAYKRKVAGIRKVGIVCIQVSCGSTHLTSVTRLETRCIFELTYIKVVVVKTSLGHQCTGDICRFKYLILQASVKPKLVLLCP